MPRLQPVNPETATGKAKELLDGVQRAIGGTPNLLRTLAQAPAALDGYLSLSKALSGGALSAALREQIALAVAGENHCDYCASAHTQLGRGAGVAKDELAANLLGRSSDSKTEAVLTFAKAVVKERGFVDDQTVDAARAAGLGDPEIAEIIANVALNVFTNYFNHVAKTEIDFPVVDAGEAQFAR